MVTPRTGHRIMVEVSDDETTGLSFLLNMIQAIIKLWVCLLILGTNFLLAPFVLSYIFWEYLILFWWYSVKYVACKVLKSLKIVPLGLEIWFWSVACGVMVLLYIKNTQQVSAIIEEQIYSRFKEILLILHVLPLSPKYADSLNAMLKKMSIFSEHYLPYPNFLFEDAIADTDDENGTVATTTESGAETNPSDSSTTASTDLATASSETTPVTDDPKPENDPTSEHDPKPENDPQPKHDPKPETDQHASSSGVQNLPKIDEVTESSN